MIFLSLFLVLVTADAVSAICLSNATCNGNGYCPIDDSGTSPSGPFYFIPIACTRRVNCICDPGFSGRYCNIPPDCLNINDTSCGDNGRCFQYACLCTNKYTGKFCQIPPVCTRSGNDCGQYGECNTCNYGFHKRNNFCMCNSGYGGITCREPPVCTIGGNECKNGGTCDYTAQPANCTCPPGYAYPTCEFKITEQKPNSGSFNILSVHSLFIVLYAKLI